MKYKMDKAQETSTIRALNDQLRNSLGSNPLHGSILGTRRVQALDDDVRQELFEAVRLYDDFTEDNDPNGEHDFGTITITGAVYFWKIDCYDNALQNHSPNPADDKRTRRVLTVMHSDEY